MSDGETLTGIDAARAILESETHLDARERADLLACSLPEVEALVAAYRDATRAPDPTTWDRVLAILTLAATVAGKFIPIAGSIAAVATAEKAVTK